MAPLDVHPYPNRIGIIIGDTLIPLRTASIRGKIPSGAKTGVQRFAAARPVWLAARWQIVGSILRDTGEYFFVLWCTLIPKKLAGFQVH